MPRTYGAGVYGIGKCSPTGPFTLPEGFEASSGPVGVRLSLSPSEPVPRADITGSTVYLVPTRSGNAAPYIECGELRWLKISETLDGAGPSLSLAGLPAWAKYDLYLTVLDDGPALVRTAWKASADISLGGYLFNANAVLSYRTNGSALSLESKRGLYLGSVLISDTPGICRCDVSFGQSRQWGLWNYYNQECVTLRAGEPDRVYQGHKLNNPEYQPFAANCGNSLTVFSGRPVSVDLSYKQSCWRQSYAGYWTIALTGIGWNCSTEPRGVLGQFNVEGNTSNICIGSTEFATAHIPDCEGVNLALMLLKVIFVGGTTVSNGTSVMCFGNTETDHCLTAKYRA